MSSYATSSRTNNNNKASQQEENEPEELLNQGIEKIYHSFNINNKIYKEKINEDENIINGLTKKLEMLNNEIEMLKRENQYYKTQNENLKKEVEKLNRIVKNIQGKLSNVDFQINECIKADNIKPLNFKKNYENHKKKKNIGLCTNLKNKENNQSLFQMNSKNIFTEEVEKNAKYNNKNTKNRKLLYYIDNNRLKENLNKNKNNYDDKKDKDNDNSYYNYERDNNIGNKYNKTKAYNSFENLDNNEYKNLYKKDEKLKTPNSVLYKNVITKEEKKKNSFIKEKEKDNEQIRDTSFSYHENSKNRSYSSKLFLKDRNLISKNKTSDEIEINNDINNDDLINIGKNNSNNKGVEEKICLTYDNLFNRKNTNKKNTYTSFRGKILKKKLSDNIFKNDENYVREKIVKYDSLEKTNKKDEITYFLKKCKMLLDKELFDKIMKLFKEYKEGLLTDEGIIFKTHKNLGSHKELIELFNKIFTK